MKINTKPKFTEITHEGAQAAYLNTKQKLRRSVLSCLLWEREFYEDGEDISTRVYELAQKRPAEEIAELAIEARTRYKLRHIPLVLLSALAKHGKAVTSDAIVETINRADEIAEFLAIHAKLNKADTGSIKKVMTAQIKKGLSRAFLKFDAYQLAKYDRAGKIRLRDALFLCHARPDTPEREMLWKELINGTLPIPDTWEVSLSAGADKKETFERLLSDGKLGYLALLRNLRNMTQANVREALIRKAILERKGAQSVLPFRFVAAARAVPQYEPWLDQAMLASMIESPVMAGVTIFLVDVSGSMDELLSQRSDLTRMDAACALASIANVESRRVFSFSEKVVEVPPRLGMAGIDAVRNSQPHWGTYLGRAVKQINKIPHDRLIIITDEQSHDDIPDPVVNKAYLINVASNKNGIGSSKWTRIDGFSESVLRYISEIEKEA